MRAGGRPRSRAKATSAGEGCQSGDSREPRSADFFACDLLVEVTAKTLRSSASTKRTPSAAVPPRAKWPHNSSAIGVLGRYGWSWDCGTNSSSCDMSHFLAPAFGMANPEKIRKVKAIVSRCNLLNISCDGGCRNFRSIRCWQCLVAPCLPSFAWRTAAIEFDLGERWKILLDHFEEALGLGRVLGARRHNQRFPLRAQRGTRDVAFDADQENFVLFTTPIAEADLVLSPCVAGFVFEAAQPQHVDRNGEML